MKLDFSFRNHERSEHVVSYAEEKLSKIKKYSMKPNWVEVVLSSQRNRKKCEIILNGERQRFVATAYSNSFEGAIDISVAKLCRQMSKRKEKVQNHKHYQKSDEYALEYYANEQLEYDFHPKKGTGRRVA